MFFGLINRKKSEPTKEAPPIISRAFSYKMLMTYKTQDTKDGVLVPAINSYSWIGKLYSNYREAEKASWDQVLDIHETIEDAKKIGLKRVFIIDTSMNVEDIVTITATNVDMYVFHNYVLAATREVSCEIGKNIELPPLDANIPYIIK